MRKAHIFENGATVDVCCTVGHTSVASFMCLSREGAEAVARAFEAVGAAGAAMVYTTVFGADFAKMAA